MALFQGKKVEVPPAGDPWWEERPPDLEGRTRAEATVESAAGMWRAGDGLDLDHAAETAIALLMRADPDDFLRGSALSSAIDDVKARVRGGTWRP